MREKVSFWAIFKENWKLSIHKFWVARYMFKLCCALMRRAWRHDFSKFSKHEAPLFAKANNIGSLKYGTEAYKENLKTIQPALDHHYKHNSHHPQHYRGGLMDMGILDWSEMLCDWRAATRRTEGGSIKFSIEENQERFGYSDEVKAKFVDFLKETKLWSSSYNVYKRKDNNNRIQYTMIPDDAGWVFEECEKQCELVFSSPKEKEARKYYESVSRSIELEWERNQK